MKTVTVTIRQTPEKVFIYLKDPEKVVQLKQLIEQ
jgi:hypothetical protein